MLAEGAEGPAYRGWWWWQGTVPFHGARLGSLAAGRSRGSASVDLETDFATALVSDAGRKGAESEAITWMNPFHDSALGMNMEGFSHLVLVGLFVCLFYSLPL